MQVSSLKNDFSKHVTNVLENHKVRAQLLLALLVSVVALTIFAFTSASLYNFFLTDAGKWTITLLAIGAALSLLAIFWPALGKQPPRKASSQESRKHVNPAPAASIQPMGAHAQNNSLENSGGAQAPASGAQKEAGSGGVASAAAAAVGHVDPSQAAAAAARHVDLSQNESASQSSGSSDSKQSAPSPITSWRRDGDIIRVPPDGACGFYSVMIALKIMENRNLQLTPETIAPLEREMLALRKEVAAHEAANVETSPEWTADIISGMHSHFGGLQEDHQFDSDEKAGQIAAECTSSMDLINSHIADTSLHKDLVPLFATYREALLQKNTHATDAEFRALSELKDVCIRIYNFDGTLYKEFNPSAFIKICIRKNKSQDHFDPYFPGAEPQAARLAGIPEDDDDIYG